MVVLMALILLMPGMPGMAGAGIVGRPGRLFVGCVFVFLHGVRASAPAVLRRSLLQSGQQLVERLVEFHNPVIFKLLGDGVQVYA